MHKTSFFIIFLMIYPRKYYYNLGLNLFLPQINQLGVILDIDSSTKEKSYGILVLKSRAEKSTVVETESKRFYDYLSLASLTPDFEDCLAAGHEV